MKHYYITIILAGYFIISCNVNNKGLIRNYLPNGRWISVQDSMEIIRVNGHNIYSFYDNQPVDTTRYKLITNSCNSDYKSQKDRTTFLILHENLCYEVEAITESYIELTFTSNGKTLTFRRM